MSKNIKTDYKIKLRSVLEYKEGNKKILDLSISREQIRRWVHKYESLGEEGFKNKTTSNRRNGYSKKTVKLQYGNIELDIPRDIHNQIME